MSPYLASTQIELGGRCPAASAWLPPDNVLTMSTLSGDTVSSVVFLCFGLVFGLFLIGVCFVYCCLVRKHKNGQVLGQNSVGSLFNNRFVSGIASRGRFPWRGLFGSLGATVLLDDSSKAQGGPWAPPPCDEHSPETL